MSDVAIVDTTLRDGHQSLWATRMTTAMMLGVAESMDRAGYHVIDLSAAVNFETCVRYLGENPWERLRQMRRKVARTPLQALVRSRNFISFDVMPDDLMELLYARLHANGIRRFFLFDGLHDRENFHFGLEICRRLGVSTLAALTYTLSPVHTDEYYARKAREFRDLGADAILLKDPPGLLTLDRIRTLVPALRRAVPDRPLEIHTHCLTGLAPMVVLEAATLGTEVVHTAIPPLANGPSHPSVFDVVENLRLMGHGVPLDLEPIREASSFLMAVAANEGLPVGQAARYDLNHYKLQMPGGVLTNLQAQLRDAGMEEKLGQVLEEIPRVREELGWPIMVSPYAQFVCIQALMNIVQGERYSTVMDEIAKWVYGYYGELEAPVAPEVMDRVVERASRRISPTPQPPEPVLPVLRRAFPSADEDELVLRGFFKGTQVDRMLVAPPMRLVYEFDRDLVGLVRRLVSVADSGRLVLSTVGLEFAWQR